MLNLALVSLLLVGCNDNSGANDIGLTGDIESIEIQQLIGNKETFKVDDQELVKEFQKVFDDTEKMNGNTEIAEPIYSLNITYATEETEQVCLWVTEPNKRSTLMKDDDTYTLYTVSEEMTNILIDLVVSKF
ncbi:hypothetical protein J2S05_003403 [Alkalicoccobacillus murimartini]|uniref:YhfM-like domain-containing protein n=1 Tax=Alkalicoccobacillus murimartini TaxID=171685 RepID=A0ABT9YM64_9BACI|nr:hypothetical protein [Alkalicoccobacillus murimartini]